MSRPRTGYPCPRTSSPASGCTLKQRPRPWAANAVSIEFFPPPSLRLLPRCLPAVAVLAAAWLACAPAAQAQTIVSTVGLSFGSFVASTGGAIAVAPSGGRSKTGSVMLVAQGGGSTAAQFTVSGTAAAIYTITLPADATVALMDDSGHSMALNGFVSDPGATGTLSSGGTQMLSVGATLSVNNSQAPGNYSGAFAVTVHHN